MGSFVKIFLIPENMDLLIFIAQLGHFRYEFVSFEKGWPYLFKQKVHTMKNITGSFSIIVILGSIGAKNL